MSGTRSCSWRPTCVTGHAALLSRATTLSRALGSLTKTGAPCRVSPCANETLPLSAAAWDSPFGSATRNAGTSLTRRPTTRPYCCRRSTDSSWTNRGLTSQIGILGRLTACRTGRRDNRRPTTRAAESVTRSRSTPTRRTLWLIHHLEQVRVSERYAPRLVDPGDRWLNPCWTASTQGFARVRELQ